MREFPMLLRGGKVPWSWGEQFYQLYNAVHPGNYSSAEALANRGGVSWGEVELFLRQYKIDTGKNWKFKND